MFDVQTLLSLLLLERLAGPRAATRVLLICVGITAAPALLLGVWLCGTLAWQWGSRTWADVAHRARPVAQWQAPVPDLTTPDLSVRRAQPTGDAQRAELPDLSVRRAQAIEDLRAVHRYGQAGPAREACLRIPVDFGRPLPERTLLALEAACHPLAANPSGLTPDELSRRYFPAGK